MIPGPILEDKVGFHVLWGNKNTGTSRHGEKSLCVTKNAGSDGKREIKFDKNRSHVEAGKDFVT